MKKHTILFLLLTTIGFSQEVTKRLRTYNEQFVDFQNREKFDSIIYISDQFLSNDDLNSFEKQYVYFHKGVNYNSIGRYDKAIENFKKSIYYKTTTKLSGVNYNLCIYSLSDVFFTKKDFEKAFQYALQSCDKQVVEEDFNAYINVHSILGYCYFLKKEYKKSLSQYQKASSRAKIDDPCKLSEVYRKRAMVYSSLGDIDTAKNDITAALKISDSCKETINKINTYKALREILTENKKFEEANKIFTIIDSLNSENENNHRNRKIDSLETVYKTKLKEGENNVLKATLSRQQLIIYGTIIALVIFTVLLLLVFMLSKKQKAANKELEKQKQIIEINNKELQRLNVLNQKIFSVISHDFKEPILTLRAFLSSNSVSFSENTLVKNYLNEVNNQLEQSDAMLNSLLDWAKVELQIKYGNSNKTNLFTTTEMILLQLQNKSKEKNIIINNLILSDVVVKFPQEIITIVLRNIVNNAIKFSYENSKIDIKFANNILEIQDYGDGIDEDKLERLFAGIVNPGIGTKQESGFGLGLYLSNELMQKNNGYIRSKNHISGGCSFYIYFPN